MSEQELRALAVLVALNVQTNTAHSARDTNAALAIAGLSYRVVDGAEAYPSLEAIRKEARQAGLL